MAFRLREVSELAAEVGGMAKAKKMLTQVDAQIVGGYYDHGALEALKAEPATTNIGRSKVSQMTLASTDGLGAVMAVCQKAGLDVVRHLYKGVNFVTVRNKKGQRRYVKVYTCSRLGATGAYATYPTRGILKPDAPNHYMFVCFEGPMGWVFTKSQLRALHGKAVEAEEAIFYSNIRAHVPKASLKEVPGGVLNLRLYVDAENFLLKAPRQLGL